jgi:hypothetical protein
MITYHKEYGLWFQLTEDSKHYGIYKMVTYSGDNSIDIAVVFDFDRKEIVTQIWEASAFDMEDLDCMIESKVTAYEAKTRVQATPKIKYPFNKVGISAFMNDVADDIMNHGIYGDFKITHGKRTLAYPDTAECWEALSRCLDDALEEWEG